MTPRQRYRQSPKGKATERAYKHGEKYQAWDRAYKKRRYAEGRKSSLIYFRSRKGQDGVLRRKFGISLEDKERMYENQKGLCKLCEEPIPFNAPIDHCHKTKKIRGMVHQKCNVFIGLAESYPKMLQNLSKFLEI